MEMLMAEYRNKQSANPFIALLDGYIGMKKRKNPEYEWRGLATTVPEGNRRAVRPIGQRVSR